MSIVGEKYPGDIEVKFPIDPEGFFVKDPAVRAGIVEITQPEKIAA